MSVLQRIIPAAAAFLLAASLAPPRGVARALDAPPGPGGKNEQVNDPPAGEAARSGAEEWAG